MEENTAYSPRLRTLLNKARTAWLFPIEYAEILESFEPEPAVGGSANTLCNWKSPFAPLFVTTSFETPPPSGTLCIYDRAWLTKQRIKIKVDGHDWKTRGGSYQREDTVNLEVLSTKSPRPRLCSSSGGRGGAGQFPEEVSRPVHEMLAGVTAPVRSVERKVNLLGQYAHHATSSRFHRRTYHLGRSGGAAAAAAAAVAAVACLGTAEEANLAAANAAKRRVEDLHIVHYLEDHAPIPKPQNSASRPSSSKSSKRSNSSKDATSDFSSSSRGEYSIEAPAEPSSSGATWGDDVSAFADLMTEAMTEDDAFGDNCEALLGSNSDLNSDHHHTGPFEFSSEVSSSLGLRSNSSSASPTPRVETPPLPRPLNAPHGKTDSFDSQRPFKSVSDHSIATPMVQSSSNSPCCILDLAPECCDIAGGTKVLLVLSDPIQTGVHGSEQSPHENLYVGFRSYGDSLTTESVLQSNALGISAIDARVGHHSDGSSISNSSSGWTWVEGLAVGSAVVRCLAPPMQPGAAQVVVACHVPSLNHQVSSGSTTSIDSQRLQFLTPFQDDALAANSRVMFRYTGGARNHDFLQPSWASASMENSVAVPPRPPISQASFTTSGSQDRLSRSREEESNHLGGSAWMAEEQERKIRVVARPEPGHPQPPSLLNASVTTSGGSSYSGNSSYNSDNSGRTNDTSDTSGASALGNSSFNSMGSRGAGGAVSGEEDGRILGLDGLLVDGEALPELLDDASLHQLGELELEDVLERLLMRVVQQMVLLAAGDDDLKEELNAPDKSGLCLLHYASLYNLLPLVPILLKHGARVDEATASLDVQTPLHLAAGAGHAAVVEALVGHGAPLAIRDGAGLTPRERALSQGQHHVAARLHQLTNGSAPDYAPPSAVFLEQAASDTRGWRGTDGSNSSNRLGSASSDMSDNAADSDQHCLHVVIDGKGSQHNINHGMCAEGQNHEPSRVEQNVIGHQASSITASPLQISGKRTMDAAGVTTDGAVSTGVAATIATHTLPAGSPGSRSGHLGLTLQNVAMLQDAFTTLSLKEKCLLRSGVARHSLSLGLFRGSSSSNVSGSLAGSAVGESGDKLGLAAATRAAIEAAANAAKSEHGNNSDDGSGGVESEVASVITESDKESLDVAMAMMEPNERAEVEKEARVLQKNMKAWMMRRNYKAMRDSARKLQFLWRENKASTAGDDSGSGGSSSSSNGSNCRRVQRSASLNPSGPERPGGLGSIDEHSTEHLDRSSSCSSEDGGNSSTRIILPRVSVRNKDLAVGNGNSENFMDLSSEGNPSKSAGNEGSNDEELVDQVISARKSSVGGDDNDGGEDEEHEGIGEDQMQEEAGRKLQAGARGMLARRNFRRIKRQTLAMIVIQRTLLRRRNRASSFADLPVVPPTNSTINDGSEGAATEMVMDTPGDWPDGSPPSLSSFTGGIAHLSSSHEAGREALSSFWALESGGDSP